MGIVVRGFRQRVSRNRRELAKSGTQVVVPYRDEDEKRHLKVMGDLGQIVPMVCLLHGTILYGALIASLHPTGVGFASPRPN